MKLSKIEWENNARKNGYTEAALIVLHGPGVVLLPKKERPEHFWTEDPQISNITALDPEGAKLLSATLKPNSPPQATFETDLFFKKLDFNELPEPILVKIESGIVHISVYFEDGIGAAFSTHGGSFDIARKNNNEP